MTASVPHRSDPLADVLLRPTSGGTPPAEVREKARDLALHPQHDKVRAGTALGRSRSAILAGAARAVQTNGARISMSQVAVEAGVAKATLYNHFRTREDILSSLMVAEIDRLIAEVGHLSLRPALIRSAVAVSEHPMLEALVAEDTTLLAILGRVDVRSEGWMRVAEATEALLTRSQRRGTPMVLRWLSSFVVAPAELEDIEADVDILITGLPPL